MPSLILIQLNPVHANHTGQSNTSYLGPYHHHSYHYGMSINSFCSKVNAIKRRTTSTWLRISKSTIWRFCQTTGCSGSIPCPVHAMLILISSSGDGAELAPRSDDGSSSSRSDSEWGDDSFQFLHFHFLSISHPSKVCWIRPGCIFREPRWESRRGEWLPYPRLGKKNLKISWRLVFFYLTWG